MDFCWFLILLVFFVRKSLEQAVDSRSSRLKSADNVLGRRLQQGDNVCDEFVFALDSSQGVELVGTEVDCFFNVCAFELGQFVALLHKVFEELCGCITHVGAHQRCRLFQGRVKLAVVTVEALEGLVEECVLDNDKFDVGVEARTAQCRCLLCIESGSLYKVEAAVLTQGVGDFVYDVYKRQMMRALSSFFMLSCGCGVKHQQIWGRP